MFSRLLVPLDGSALAESALPAAIILARRLPARMTVLHILEPHAFSKVHGDRHLTHADEAEAYLDQIVAQLAAQRVQASALVRPGSADVARAIAEAASAVSADLTVLCTHGRGGIRGALFGSVAQQVLQHGTTPVLLTRPEVATDFTCHRILVPLDRSVSDATALPAATTIARACAADIVLVSVVPTPDTAPPERAATRLMPSAAAEVLDLEAQQTREYLQTVAGQLTLDGIPASGVVERGDAVRMVLAAVASYGADLIVMATHGRSGIAGAWAGSIAARVIGHGDVPVLMVRIPAPQ